MVRLLQILRDRMKNAIIKVLLAAITILLIVASALGYRCRALSQDRGRLRDNQNALLGEIKTYKVRDSLNAISVQALTLKNNEFSTHFEEMTALIEDMNLKLKRVESISQAATQSNYRISAPVRDTILISVDSSATRARTVNYSSPHIEFHGIVAGDKFDGEIHTYDTLTQVLHRVPRKFLFIRWGTKEVRQEVVSSNPHTELTFSRIIKLQK